LDKQVRRKKNKQKKRHLKEKKKVAPTSVDAASPRSDDQSLTMTVVGTIPVAASPPFNVLIIQCKSEVFLKKKTFYCF
jgi:hypothetical protein